MLTTVYFATNRAFDGQPEDWTSYGTRTVAPSDPWIHCGDVFVSTDKSLIAR